MTFNTLPGIKFGETVTSNSTITSRPLFIIQTSQEITAIDNKLTKYDDVSNFETVATGKGLTQTIKFIKDAITEETANTGQFYVYSVKDDTADGFKNILIDNSNYADIKDVYYFEETKSGANNSLTLAQKIGALITGLNNNSLNGVFRMVYIIPYGTIQDAVTNKGEGVTTQQAYINSLETITEGVDNGRVGFILPDDLAGVNAGKINATNYNEEVGFTEYNTAITELNPVFSYTQMVTLQNLGVIFTRKEQYQGNTIYRINLGVTSSFSNTNNKADSLIISRRIADELLRQVKDTLDAYIKDKETENTLAFMQSDINEIINTFENNDEIISDGTVLEVSESATPYTVNVSGAIQPITCIIAIEVNTILQNTANLAIESGDDMPDE